MFSDVHEEIKGVHKASPGCGINIIAGRSTFSETSKHECNKDVPFDEYSMNIKDTSRNRDKKMIPDICNNVKIIIAMTGDLLFDLNIDRTKVQLVNPRLSDYKSLMELIRERSDLPCERE